MSIIKEVYAREVLSASGVPTLEVDLLMDNFIARAAVPSTKVQDHAVVLRDKKPRFHGMGVTRAAAYAQYYASRHLKGMDARQQCDVLGCGVPFHVKSSDYSSLRIEQRQICISQLITPDVDEMISRVWIQ